jgi:hypothetical protein
MVSTNHPVGIPDLGLLLVKADGVISHCFDPVLRIPLRRWLPKFDLFPSRNIVQNFKLFARSVIALGGEKKGTCSRSIINLTESFGPHTFLAASKDE